MPFAFRYDMRTVTIQRRPRLRKLAELLRTIAERIDPQQRSTLKFSYTIENDDPTAPAARERTFIDCRELRLIGVYETQVPHDKGELM